MEIKTFAKKWGSSIGIILPKAVVEAKKIRENDEITIEIKKCPSAGEMFGKFPKWSRKSSQELKEEMRKGWS